MAPYEPPGLYGAGPVTGVEVGVEVREYEANVFLNPVRDRFAIRYSLPRQSNVKAVVCDAGGRKVRTLINAIQPAGEHTYHYEAAAVLPKNGQYTVVLTFDQEMVVRRIVRMTSYE